MTRRTASFLTSFLALTILLALAAVLVLADYLEDEGFRQDLESVLREATGRNVTLAGPLHLELYPWLALAAEDVRLAAPPEFGPAPLLTARKVSLRIRPLPLLRRQLSTDRVRVGGLELNLVALADGRTNWDGLPERLAAGPGLGTPASAGGSLSLAGFRIQGLDLDDALVRYSDQGSGRTLEGRRIRLRTGTIAAAAPLDIALNATLHAPGLAWPVRAETRARLTGLGQANRTLTLSGLALRTLGPLTATDPDPVLVSMVPAYDPSTRTLTLRNMNATVLGASLTGEARLSGLPHRPELNATLRVQDAHAHRLLKALFHGSDLAQYGHGLGAAQASGHLRLTNSSLTLERFHLALDNAQVEGSLALEDFRKPRISFDLRSPALHLEQLLARILPPPAHKGTEGPNQAGAKEIQAAGRLAAGELTGWGLKLQDAALGLTLSGGSLGLKVDQARAFGGKLKAQAGADLPGAVRGAPKTLRARLALDLDGAEAQAVTDSLNLPRVLTGKVDLSTRLSATGPEWADLDRAVNGTVTLKAQKGALLAGARGDKSDPAPRPVLAFAQGQVRATLSPLGHPPAPAARPAPNHPAAGHPAGSPASPARPGRPGEAARSRLSLDASLTGEPQDGHPQYVWTSSLQGEAEFSPRPLGLTLSGASFSAALEGGFLPGWAGRASMTGTGDFDSTRGTAALRRTRVKAQTLDLEVEAVLRDLWAVAWSASGTLTLPQCNPRDLLRMFKADPPHAADDSVLRHLNGQASFALTPDRLSLSGLTGTLDSTAFQGELGLTGFAKPSWTFRLHADTLNMDRYMPPRPAEPEHRAGPPQATPLELDLLRSLDLEGSLALDRFTYRNLIWTGLTADLSARNGRFAFAPIRAAFYGGRHESAFRGEVTAYLLKASMDITLKDFEAGPFMAALADRDYVRGRTTMYYDLHSMGATDLDFLRNLQGKAGFSITDGSYKFFGYEEPQATAQPEGAGMGVQADADTRGQRTVFNTARANFKVEQGYFSNQDLLLKGLLIEGGGRGGFSLPDDTIDYTLTMNMVHATSLPVHLSGRLSDPDVSVPKGQLLTNTVKDVLDIPLKPLRFLRDLLLPGRK